MYMLFGSLIEYFACAELASTGTAHQEQQPYGQEQAQEVIGRAMTVHEIGCSGEHRQLRTSRNGIHNALLVAAAILFTGSVHSSGFHARHCVDGD